MVLAAVNHVVKLIRALIHLTICEVLLTVELAQVVTIQCGITVHLALQVVVVEQLVGASQVIFHVGSEDVHGQTAVGITVNLVEGIVTHYLAVGLLDVDPDFTTLLGFATFGLILQDITISIRMGVVLRNVGLQLVTEEQVQTQQATFYTRQDLFTLYIDIHVHEV